MLSERQYVHHLLRRVVLAHAGALSELPPGLSCLAPIVDRLAADGLIETGPFLRLVPAAFSLRRRWEAHLETLGPAAEGALDWIVLLEVAAEVAKSRAISLSDVTLEDPMMDVLLPRPA